MKFLLLLLLVVTAINVDADHLIVGNVADRVVLGHHTLIEYNAIPFMKRVKMYFFSDPQQRIIQKSLPHVPTEKESLNLKSLSEGLRMANELCDFFMKIDPPMERSLIFKRIITNGSDEYQSELMDLLQAAKQGIQALDTLHSKASINITAGGVGQSFVNLRLKSERGWGLGYDVGIYMNDNLYQRIPGQ